MSNNGVSAQDLTESYQDNIIACAVATWGIAAMFVGLRFFLRAYMIKVLGWEDWVILASLGFSALLSTSFILEAHFGLGRHMLVIGLADRERLAETGWFALLWFALTVLATKLSILLLYMRTLTYDWVQRALWFLLTMVLLTGLTGIGLIFTACIPLQAYWDRMADATYCHTLQAYSAILGIQLGTDFLIFLLPLPVIWSMRAPKDQKILLLTLFSFGFFICIVSVIRLTKLNTTGRNKDSSYENVTLDFWSMIEANTGIVCACIMTMKPLLSRLARGSTRKTESSSPGQMLPGMSIHPPTIGSKPSRKTTVVKKQSWLSAQIARLDRSLQTVNEVDGTAPDHHPGTLEAAVPSEGCLPPLPLALLSVTTRSRESRYSNHLTPIEQRAEEERPLEQPSVVK